MCVLYCKQPLRRTWVHRRPFSAAVRLSTSHFPKKNTELTGFEWRPHFDVFKVLVIDQDIRSRPLFPPPLNKKNTKTRACSTTKPIMRTRGQTFCGGQHWVKRCLAILVTQAPCVRQMSSIVPFGCLGSENVRCQLVANFGAT